MATKAIVPRPYLRSRLLPLHRDAKFLSFVTLCKRSYQEKAAQWWGKCNYWKGCCVLSENRRHTEEELLLCRYIGDSPGIGRKRRHSWDGWLTHYLCRRRGQYWHSKHVNASSWRPFNCLQPFMLAMEFTQGFGDLHDSNAPNYARIGTKHLVGTLVWI